MKAKFLLVVVLILFSKNIISQACYVGIDSLKGMYTGDCKKGKANGKGNAIGVDSYLGNFKNGYPDGEGKYIWKNGNSYEGNWENGLFNGFGSLNKLTALHENIIITGYWKKGEYIGKFENPYTCSVMTNNISDINIRKHNKFGSEIIITIKNNSGGASNIEHPVLPKSDLTNIVLTCGRFEEKIIDTSSRIANRYILRQVTFPFCATLLFETPGKAITVDQAKIEINETGYWSIKVNIDN